jgi:hypothetical protein
LLAGVRFVELSLTARKFRGDAGLDRGWQKGTQDVVGEDVGCAG